MKSETAFFVHIPKTAGTSFRKTLESHQRFKMLYDYGNRSPETLAQLVNISETAEKKDLSEIFDENRINVFCGHVFYKKYAHFVEPHAVLSVLRNPVERLISEYQHLKRHAGFEATFREFIQSPLQTNKQCKMLKGVDINAGGLFGLTSHYDAFIELVRRTRGWDLGQVRLNVAPETDHGERYALPIEDVEAAYYLNRKDLEFFFKITKVFRDQLQMCGINTIPSREIRYNCNIVDSKKIIGWFSKSDNDCFFVVLDVNGNRRAIVALDQQRADVCKHGLSESSRCGFSYPLALLGANRGDIVGITLLGAPWCAKKLVFEPVEACALV